MSLLNSAQARVRAAIRMIWLIVVTVCLVLFSAGSWQAHAQDGQRVTRTYIVEYSPSAADLGQLSLARQNLGRVDQDVLLTLAQMSAEASAAWNAYQDLQEAANAIASAGGRWLVEDIPVSIMRSFEEGNAPESAVRRAAKETSWLGEEDAVPSGAIAISSKDIGLDSENFSNLIVHFDEALKALPEAERQLLETSDPYPNLSDEVLIELAGGADPVAGEAQLELDRRLAQNLPDLSGALNGQLDPELLCPIPWDPEQQLLCASMDNFVRMNEEYRGVFGTDLPILNGYRTLEGQYVAHQHSPTMTAIPGTSNHGLGQAIDFDWDVFKYWDDPEVIWMVENGPRFGFRHPAVLGPDTDRPEPWHYEFGTTYTGVDEADFRGPTPSVIYRIQSPWNP